MSSTEKFIRDAIEGGWTPYDFYGTTRCSNLKFPIDMVDLTSFLVENIQTVIIQPKTWKAVGKKRGWSYSKRDDLFTPIYPPPPGDGSSMSAMMETLKLKAMINESSNEYQEEYDDFFRVFCKIWNIERIEDYLKSIE